MPYITYQPEHETKDQRSMAYCRARACCDNSRNERGLRHHDVAEPLVPVVDTCGLRTGCDIRPRTSVQERHLLAYRFCQELAQYYMSCSDAFSDTAACSPDTQFCLYTG